MPSYRKADMIEAIQKAGGILAVAARALGCSRQTLYNYMERYPDVRAAYDEANETNLDVAEAVLLEQVRGKDKEQVRFYLRTKGRARGYGDRLTVGFNPAELTDEQLAAIAAGKPPEGL